MNSLETAVLEMIGEDPTSPDVFLDDAAGMDQIRQSLNDAIQEIGMLTGGLRRKVRIPLYAGAIFYQLDLAQDLFAWPLSCFLINQRRKIPQKDILWLNKANPRWMQGSGSPLFYFMIGFDKIGFDRAPSASGDIVELDCVMIPGRYQEDNDRIKLREEYKWAAVHYAVSEFWASRGDANEAKMHFAEYVTHIGIQELYPLTNERVFTYRTEKQQAVAS